MTGFLRCKKCGYAAAANGKNGTYYHSVQKAVKGCEKFKPVKMAEIENAVFEMLWEFTFDRPHFLEAVKDLDFDAEQREKLEGERSQTESELAEIDKRLNNSSQSLADGAKYQTIKPLEDELYSHQKKLQKDLDAVNDKLLAYEESDDLNEKAETDPEGIACALQKSRSNQGNDLC